MLNTLELPNVDTIDFSYFPEDVRECNGTSSGNVFPKGPCYTTDARR